MPPPIVSEPEEAKCVEREDSTFEARPKRQVKQTPKPHKVEIVNESYKLTAEENARYKKEADLLEL